MHYSALLLALASSAIALPTLLERESDDSGLQAPPTCERFSIAFTVDGYNVSANAVVNGTSVLLMGQRLSVYPGTEAYLNRSNPNPDPNEDYLALNFILPDGGVYGAFAPDVEDIYGNSGPIYLEQDDQQFEWLVNNGSVGHKLYAAPNSLYACNGTLATGESGVFLSFGDYRFTPVSGPPTGCAFTKVYQNFNVDGGAEPDDE